MMYRNLAKLFAAGLLAASCAPAYAADPAPPPESSDWTFTAAAYLWGSGIEGKAGVFGLPPQDVDVSFADILQNLDMAVMAAGEARNGRFSIGMDIVYANIGTDVDTPFGVLTRNIDVTTEQFLGTAVAGYAVVDTGTARLDLVAGARLWYIDTEFDFNGGALDGRTVSDGDTWIDPLVGAKFYADLGSDFYAAGWGMIGGFGVSSDIMWDVMGGLGYQFNDSFSAFAGYRALGVDYSNDGFVYDVTQHGPVVAGVFKF